MNGWPGAPVHVAASPRHGGHRAKRDQSGRIRKFSTEKSCQAPKPPNPNKTSHILVAEQFLSNC